MERTTAMVEGKSLDEARWHHELLVEDMASIEPAESTPRLAWLGHPPWSSSPTSPQTSSASPTMELAFRVISDLSQIGSANNFSSHQRQDFASATTLGSPQMAVSSLESSATSASTTPLYTTRPTSQIRGTNVGARRQASLHLVVSWPGRVLGRWSPLELVTSRKKTA